jgi:hypothetical protein
MPTLDNPQILILAGYTHYLEVLEIMNIQKQ